MNTFLVSLSVLEISFALVALVALVLFGFIIYWIVKDPKKVNVVQKADYDANEQLLCLYFTDGTKKIYKGSNTTWYLYPENIRCDEDVEWNLGKIEGYIQKTGLIFYQGLAPIKIKKC